MISQERIDAAASALIQHDGGALIDASLDPEPYTTMARIALEAGDQVALSEEQVEDGAIALNAEISAIPWAQQTPPIHEWYRRQARAVLNTK